MENSIWLQVIFYGLIAAVVILAGRNLIETIREGDGNGRK
jgi:hypothetical protein